LPETKHYDIRVKNYNEIPVYSIRKKVLETPDEIAGLMNTVLEKIASLGGKCSGPPIVLYYKDLEFNSMYVDLEVAWPITDTTLANKILPPVHAATLVEYLDDSNNRLEEAYTALYAWIKKIGYHPDYPIREVYYTDPQATTSEQLTVEIIIPLTKEH